MLIVLRRIYSEGAPSEHPRLYSHVFYRTSNLADGNLPLPTRFVRDPLLDTDPIDLRRRQWV